MRIRECTNIYVPTYCFIYGMLGHSEQFCLKLFSMAEKEIVKPYGVWIRAQLRRQISLLEHNGCAQARRRKTVRAVVTGRHRIMYTDESKL